MRVLLISPEGVNSFLKGPCFGGASKRPATVRRVRTRSALGKASARRPPRQNSTPTPARLGHPGPASWPDCLARVGYVIKSGRALVYPIYPATYETQETTAIAWDRRRSRTGHRTIQRGEARDRFSRDATGNRHGPRSAISDSVRWQGLAAARTSRCDTPPTNSLERWEWLLPAPTKEAERNRPPARG